MVANTMWRNRDSLQNMTDSFHRSRDNSIEYKDSTREAAMLSGRQKVGINYSYIRRIRKFGKKRNKWKNYNTCNKKLSNFIQFADDQNVDRGRGVLHYLLVSIRGVLGFEISISVPLQSQNQPIPVHLIPHVGIIACLF